VVDAFAPSLTSPNTTKLPVSISSESVVGDDTDWKKIVALCDALVEITHSPVVELNRAVAVSMAFGPAAGLELVDALIDEPLLRSYHLLPSVRGDLLMKLGRTADARGEFERAASLAQNARERDLLLARATVCGRPANERRTWS